MAETRRFSLNPTGTLIAIILVVLALAGTIYAFFGPV